MKHLKLLLLICLINLGVIASVFILYTLLRGRQPGSRENPFQYTLEDRFTRTEPRLVRYQESLTLALPVERPYGLAVDAAGTLYITADRVLLVKKSQGPFIEALHLEAAPGPVAVDETRIYLAAGSRIEVYNKDTYIKEETWPQLSRDALITSLALSGDRLIAADARGRTVFILDKEKKKGLVTAVLDDSFIIPSPYFDTAPDREGFWVVNPGRHRLSLYSLERKVLLSWEASSFSIQGFAGCCNPVHIALTRRGRIITAEKGLPRIKVYTREGRFEGVAAGRELFTGPDPIADLAVDKQDRILVLDSSLKAVRIFTETGAEHE